MAKAAVTRSIRDDHQKNFLKIFEGLTGKHSRWEIWRDFIHLTAIEISNSTDKLNAPERTKDYQTIISKYSAAERTALTCSIIWKVLRCSATSRKRHCSPWPIRLLTMAATDTGAGSGNPTTRAAGTAGRKTAVSTLFTLCWQPWAMKCLTKKRHCRTEPMPSFPPMPLKRQMRPAKVARRRIQDATSAARPVMTTAMRSSCAERSMANDRPCKV